MPRWQSDVTSLPHTWPGLFEVLVVLREPITDAAHPVLTTPLPAGLSGHVSFLTHVLCEEQYQSWRGFQIRRRWIRRYFFRDPGYSMWLMEFYRRVPGVRGVEYGAWPYPVCGNALADHDGLLR